MGISSLVYESWMKEIQFKKYDGMLPLLDERDLVGKVIDVGIGTGLFEDYLKGRGITLDVTGVEIDQRMMDDAKKKGYNVTAASAESLPFEDDSFDFAVCLDTIHAVGDKEKAMSEMRRVLRPGKTILLSHFANVFTKAQVMVRLDQLTRGMNVIAKKVVGASDQEQSVVFLVQN